MNLITIDNAWFSVAVEAFCHDIQFFIINCGFTYDCRFWFNNQMDIVGMYNRYVRLLFYNIPVHAQGIALTDVGI